MKLQTIFLGVTILISSLFTLVLAQRAAGGGTGITQGGTNTQGGVRGGTHGGIQPVAPRDGIGVPQIGAPSTAQPGNPAYPTNILPPSATKQNPPVAAPGNPGYEGVFQPQTPSAGVDPGDTGKEGQSGVTCTYSSQVNDQYDNEHYSLFGDSIHWDGDQALIDVEIHGPGNCNTTIGPVVVGDRENGIDCAPFVSAVTRFLQDCQITEANDPNDPANPEWQQQQMEDFRDFLESLCSGDGCPGDNNSNGSDQPSTLPIE